MQFCIDASPSDPVEQALQSSQSSLRSLRMSRGLHQRRGRRGALGADEIHLDFRDDADRPYRWADLFTWGAFALFLVTTAVTVCLGHSLGMHRRLIDRSFDCPLWLERAFVYLGTLVGIGGLMA